MLDPNLLDAVQKSLVLWRLAGMKDYGRAQSGIDESAAQIVVYAQAISDVPKVDPQTVLKVAGDLAKFSDEFPSAARFRKLVAEASWTQVQVKLVEPALPARPIKALPPSWARMSAKEKFRATVARLTGSAQGA